jgi:16S rRNA (uracil1498-N3)-methyltransferase
VNLILLSPGDFIGEARVRVSGRRHEHIRDVLGATVGDSLRAGVLGGKVGLARVEALAADSVELSVSLTQAPPEPWPVTLLLALPRPKSLRRTLQCAVTMGVARIALFGAFRVERSYWKTPWLSDADLHNQVLLGLEQAGATHVPPITLHPLFKPFIEDEAPKLVSGTRRLLAHPRDGASCPSAVPGPLSLAIGPEGGFTEYELGQFERLGFEFFSLGPRVLRTEQAVPAFLGRLMPA